jgi:sacsin
LEQYPDGPNIINELIQNADDAGATRVSVLYNSCTYGTSSLLSPAMAKWQGPSLYCVRVFFVLTVRMTTIYLR